MKVKPTILLTFDVEEFDLPLEYNIAIDPNEQMIPGQKGLEEIEGLLSSHNIPTTMFTTAKFATVHSDLIRRLSNDHEIASHTYSHSHFEKTDLVKSKQVLEMITGKPVTGLRMPRMKQIDIQWAREADYQYDSSVNPAWIPGRYNNRHLPRTFYTEKEMLRLPASVSPHLRIPLFWLSFKNFPYSLYKQLCLQTLKKDGYLSLYFHSWEFTELGQYPLPKYLTRHSGKQLTDRLDKLVTDLQQVAVFTTVQHYITNHEINAQVS